MFQRLKLCGILVGDVWSQLRFHIAHKMSDNSQETIFLKIPTLGKWVVYTSYRIKMECQKNFQENFQENFLLWIASLLLRHGFIAVAASPVEVWRLITQYHTFDIAVTVCDTENIVIWNKCMFRNLNNPQAQLKSGP